MDITPIYFSQLRRADVNLRRLMLHIAVIALSTCIFFTVVLHCQTTSYSQHVARRHNVSTNMYKTVFTSTSMPSNLSSTQCDAECLRFERALDTWPADKPKAAVIILLRSSSSSVNDYALSMRLLSANFNDAHEYPVIVFIEENMNNDTCRQQLRSLTKSTLYIQVCLFLASLYVVVGPSVVCL